MKNAFPSRQQIEQRAYEIYVRNGCPEKSERENWLAAEQELMEEIHLRESQNPPPVDIRMTSRASHLFLNFFGLREQPFGATPDPTYLYEGKTHGEALASLSLGIGDGRGFMALIAEPGMGKTTLLYQLMEQLGDSARCMYVFQTQCDSREFLQYILHDLGVDAPGMGLVEMHSKLNELLFETLLAGKHCVLVIDEAQNLDDSVLETVRMFSNFETHRTKLLQIVLAGQPQLAAKLAQPKLSQLRQRIAGFSHLEPFNLEETAAYIDHRLKIAGHGDRPLFESEAIALIARHSQGIPRNINNICYGSLLAAHKQGRNTVNASAVEESLARLDVSALISSERTGDAAAGSGPSVVSTTMMPQDQPAPARSAPIESAQASLLAPDAPVTPAPLPALDRSVDSDKAELNPLPLSYKSGSGVSSRQWSRGATAVFAGALAIGGLLATIQMRKNSGATHAASIVDYKPVKNAPVAAVNGTSSQGGGVTYNADPQENHTGQVLTVVAEPQQTLKDISLLYVGHFDTDLLSEILALNPELKDPDHLSAGQLIRMPLPAGTLKKVVDTAEAEQPSQPKRAEGLLARVSAFIHRSQ